MGDRWRDDAADHLALCDHEAEMEFGLDLLVAAIKTQIDSQVG